MYTRACGIVHEILEILCSTIVDAARHFCRFYVNTAALFLMLNKGPVMFANSHNFLLALNSMYKVFQKSGTPV